MERNCIPSRKLFETRCDSMRILHPRMVMSAKAFLEENPRPDRSRGEKRHLRELVPLHRYQQIVDAILDASKVMAKER